MELLDKSGMLPGESRIEMTCLEEILTKINCQQSTVSKVASYIHSLTLFGMSKWTRIKLQSLENEISLENLSRNLHACSLFQSVGHNCWWSITNLHQQSTTAPRVFGTCKCVLAKAGWCWSPCQACWLNLGRRCWRSSKILKDLCWKTTFSSISNGLLPLKIHSYIFVLKMTMPLSSETYFMFATT